MDKQKQQNKMEEKVKLNTNQIYSTKDYSQFEFQRGNRDVGSRVKKLAKEIAADNLLPDFPILCYKNGSDRFRVVDGQHRLKAAESLGLPIYYHVTDEPYTNQEIAKANSMQKAWTFADYVESAIVAKNQHYIQLKEFKEKFNLSWTIAAMALSGANHEFVHLTDDIKNKKFQVRDRQLAERVGMFLAGLKEMIGFVPVRGVALAAIKLCKLPSFSTTRFFQKLQNQSTTFVKCATWGQYVEMIERIYNYRARKGDLVPLSIEIKNQSAPKGKNPNQS